MGQRVGQRGAGHVHAQDVGRDLGHELRGEAQRRRVQRRVALGLAPERVQARGEVAVGAVGLEQRGGGLHRQHQLLVVGGRAGSAPAPAARGGGGGRRRGGRRRELGQLDAEVGEDVVVEGLVALEQRLDALQEAAGLGALDDPVVVGGGHGHDLLGPDHRADPLQAHRVGDRAGGDDRALADHQARHRGDGADPAGVGERDVAAGEVVGGQRVGARLVHQRVVGVQELGEAHAPGVADDRHHQRAGAVLLLDVDGEAEVDGAVVVAVGLAVDLLEVVGHHRHVVGGDPGDRVGDQVGEGDPLAAVLELLAPLVERGHGEGAERGGGRDGAALVHVARQRGAAALDELRGLGPARPRGRAAWAGGDPLPWLSTSALVMRPPRAVPWIDERSTPSAAATRRATGEALVSAPLPAAGAVGVGVGPAEPACALGAVDAALPPLPDGAPPPRLRHRRSCAR